jgi:hypothetical protein
MKEHGQVNGQDLELSESNTDADTSESVHPRRVKNSRRWLFISLIFAVMAFLYWMFTSFQAGETAEASPLNIADSVSFTVKKVTEGVPNTVVFTYDVTRVQASSYTIQQSWDEKLRFDIDPLKHEATATYYQPGYWRAKLIIDGVVVKEEDIYITTDGWLATYEQDQSVPRYFQVEDMQGKSIMGLKPEVVQSLSSGNQGPGMLTFQIIRDFGPLFEHQFSVETRFRNTYSGGDGVCKFSNLIVVGTKGFMRIPFSVPGCVGDLSLAFKDRRIEGKDNDLSAFGCDVDSWQKVRLETGEGIIRIYLNDRLIRRELFTDDIGRVAGFRFSFLGSGEIDNFKVRGKNEEIVLE